MQVRVIMQMFLGSNPVDPVSIREDGKSGFFKCPFPRTETGTLMTIEQLLVVDHVPLALEPLQLPVKINGEPKGIPLVVIGVSPHDLREVQKVYCFCNPQRRRIDLGAMKQANQKLIDGFYSQMVSGGRFTKWKCRTQLEIAMDMKQLMDDLRSGKVVGPEWRTIEVIAQSR